MMKNEIGCVNLLFHHLLLIIIKNSLLSFYISLKSSPKKPFWILSQKDFKREKFLSILQTRNDKKKLFIVENKWKNIELSEWRLEIS